VPPDVLLFIETLKDPFSDLGVARQVLARLNQKGPFENRLQLSVMDQGKIKIASIIKFALRYLVDIVDDPSRSSLFSYWGTAEQRKQLLQYRRDKKSTELLELYVNYVDNVLSQYFNAVRAQFKTDWEDADSRLLSTTPINGFLIALRRSLGIHGVLTFDEYRTRIAKLSTDFSKTAFPFTSSQYAKYSKTILAEVFGIEEVGAIAVTKIEDVTEPA
jgi:hypothetical protein